MIYNLHVGTLMWIYLSLQACMFPTAVISKHSLKIDSAETNDVSHTEPEEPKSFRYSGMKSYEEKEVKPATIYDPIDDNLKTVVIGIIAVGAVLIISLVGCCVCCVIIVCKRTSKQLSDSEVMSEPKEILTTGEKQGYPQYFCEPSITVNKTPCMDSASSAVASRYST